MDNQEFLRRINLISDSTRLQILQILAQNKSICACYLLEKLSISQGTLSHHMKLLVKEEIVSVVKEGKWCKYTLNKKRICDLALFLQDICKDDDKSCCQ